MPDIPMISAPSVAPTAEERPLRSMPPRGAFGEQIGPAIASGGNEIYEAVLHARDVAKESKLNQAVNALSAVVNQKKIGAAKLTGKDAFEFVMDPEKGAAKVIDQTYATLLGTFDKGEVEEFKRRTNGIMSEQATLQGHAHKELLHYDTVEYEASVDTTVKHASNLLLSPFALNIPGIEVDLNNPEGNRENPMLGVESQLDLLRRNADAFAKAHRLPDSVRVKLGEDARAKLIDDFVRRVMTPENKNEAHLKLAQEVVEKYGDVLPGGKEKTLAALYAAKKQARTMTDADAIINSEGVLVKQGGIVTLNEGKLFEMIQAERKPGGKLDPADPATQGKFQQIKLLQQEHQELAGRQIGAIYAEAFAAGYDSEKKEFRINGKVQKYILQLNQIGDERATARVRSLVEANDKTEARMLREEKADEAKERRDNLQLFYSTMIEAQKANPQGFRDMTEGDRILWAQRHGVDVSRDMEKVEKRWKLMGGNPVMLEAMSIGQKTIAAKIHSINNPRKQARAKMAYDTLLQAKVYGDAPFKEAWEVVDFINNLNVSGFLEDSELDKVIEAQRKGRPLDFVKRPESTGVEPWKDKPSSAASRLRVPGVTEPAPTQPGMPTLDDLLNSTTSTAAAPVVPPPDATLQALIKAAKDDPKRKTPSGKLLVDVLDKKYPGWRTR